MFHCYRGDLIAGQCIPGGVSSVQIELSKENVEGINATFRPLLMCLSGSIHQNSSVFEDPFEFKPERWLAEDADNLLKYNVVFSVGPRMCAGKK